jgi:hypothetical protein
LALNYSLTVCCPAADAFGIFFSRYWAFNDLGMKEIVNEYVQHDTPLDNLVTGERLLFTLLSVVARPLQRLRVFGTVVLSLFRSLMLNACLPQQIWTGILRLSRGAGF